MANLEMFKLDGKKALVVGGGQGIGRCFARSLAEAEADVTVSDLNEKTGGSVVQERVRAFTPMGWYERPEDLCGALIFLALE